jgi:hypothetical protein
MTLVDRSSPSDAAAKRSHDPALDGLRGVALIMVFLLHTIILPEGTFRIFKDVIELGRLGVDLFFCLSGFLITGILYAAKNDAHYFRNFYARRALRIFPLYYFFLVLYYFLVVHWHVVHIGAAKTAEAAADLHWLWFYGTNLRIAETGTFITSSLNHFWTLAVEEHFYLIQAAMRKRPSRMICSSPIRFEPDVEAQADYIDVGAGAPGGAGVFAVGIAEGDVDAGKFFVLQDVADDALDAEVGADGELADAVGVFVGVGVGPEVGSRAACSHWSNARCGWRRSRW